MKDKLLSLIGLGAVGTPIADLLYSTYKDNFVLLSTKEFVSTLEDIYINDKLFSPQIVFSPNQLNKGIDLLFICVKNYHIENICSFISEVIDDSTIIVPLQNGVYSYEYIKEYFPNNRIIKGFAQGPNTQVNGNCIVYQKTGCIHIGSDDKEIKESVETVYMLLKNANIPVFLDEDIDHQVWKKLMLNVAGNAITALTDIDYCKFSKSKEVQELCRETMKEFISVAHSQGVDLTNKDIDDVINYYLSFKLSKKTSMLEDVINKRQTENEYICGYINRLAKKEGLYTPNINMLYGLIKIKEQIYLHKI